MTNKCKRCRGTGSVWVADATVVRCPKCSGTGAAEAAPSVEFDTREYVFSHGRSPRGRGSWAFFFERHADVSAAFWTPGSTTYAEAKKMARAEAKRRGRSVVYVGS